MNQQGFPVQSFSRDRRLRKGKVDVLWPCLLHSVSMLVTDDRLNLFETAVLRLVAIGINTPAAIADRLCLPDATLPGFILSRLEKKKLVNGGVLTDDGSVWLRNRARGRYENVLMYQDMLGGHLLPYVTMRSPTYLPATPEGNFYLESTGAANILKRRFAFFLSIPNKKVVNPTPADVSSAVHDYEMICARVPYLLDDTGPEHIRFVDDQAAIRVQPNPRKIFLHCLCILTPDARDILVNNPFGFGKDLPQLTMTLAASEHAREIKERLLELRGGRGMPAGGSPKAEADFPEISRDLEDMAQAHNAAQYVRAACSALEHILWRIMLEKDHSAAVSLLCNSGIPENLERFALAARSMEQDVDEECRTFLSVSAAEIGKTVRGHTTLRPLFALSLFLAMQGPHPLEAVLRHSAESLRTVARLNRLRNMAAHGDDAALRIDLADSEKACALVQRLYHEWRPTSAPITVPECPGIMDSDVERSLLRFFDPSVRSGLDARLDAALVNAERQFLAYAIEDLAQSDQMVSQACVVDLANLCQRALRTEAGAVDETGIVSRAEQAAKSAGFTLPEGTLPEALATTKQKFIAAAVAGRNATLGAHCLAWLLLENPEKLNTIAALCPLLLVHLAQLVRLRGHGNEAVSAQAVAQIRRHLYEDLNLFFGGNSDEQRAE